MKVKRKEREGKKNIRLRGVEVGGEQEVLKLIRPPRRFEFPKAVYLVIVAGHRSGVRAVGAGWVGGVG